MVQSIVKYCKIVLVLIFVFISIHASAWIRSTDSTLYVSAHGDILYTQLKNHLYGSDFVPAYSHGFGLDANWLPQKEYGFSAGLIYNQRSFSIDNRIPVYNNLNEKIGILSANYELNYLSVPITARYNLGDKFNIYLNAGLQFNFLLSAKKYAYKDSLPENAVETDSYEFDIRDDHPFLSLSLLGGGGAEYYITSRLTVFADIKYILDVTRLYAAKNIAGGVKPKMYAQRLQVGVRYGIPISYSVDERRR